MAEPAHRTAPLPTREETVDRFLDEQLGPRPTDPSSWLRRAIHNVVAHPLLVLCPPLGRRLHERTAPK